MFMYVNVYTHTTATFIPDWKHALVLVEVDVHFLMMRQLHVPVYKSQHVVCVYMKK